MGTRGIHIYLQPLPLAARYGMFLYVGNIPTSHNESSNSVYRFDTKSVFLSIVHAALVKAGLICFKEGEASQSLQRPQPCRRLKKKTYEYTLPRPPPVCSV